MSVTALTIKEKKCIFIFASKFLSGASIELPESKFLYCPTAVARFHKKNTSLAGPRSSKKAIFSDKKFIHLFIFLNHVDKIPIVPD